MVSVWVVAVWVVAQPVANLHEAGSLEAGVASQVLYGTTVTEEKAQGDWLQVRAEDGYPGWIRKAAVVRREQPYGREGRVARVDALAAHLYAEADVTKHAPVLTVPFETRLEVVAEPEDEDRRWLQVRLVDGGLAWIQRGDVAASERPLGVSELVVFARRFLGLPYTWGGASSFGYDCSGFTQMLCRRRGITIPRDSRPQAASLKRIEPQELAPGDLVFFGKAVDKVTHTGMYVGGGEFIHATAWKYPRVQVSRLDDSHWAELLVACRRPQ